MARDWGVAGRLRDSSGYSIITVLLMPLLLLVACSLIESAAVFSVYVTLENGVNQATRFSLTDSQFSSLAREASIKAMMRQAAPSLTIPDSAFTFSHVSSGTPGWTSGPGGPSDIERIAVDYTWTVRTPLLWPFCNNRQFHINVVTEGRFH